LADFNLKRGDVLVLKELNLKTKIEEIKKYWLYLL